MKNSTQSTCAKIALIVSFAVVVFLLLMVPVNIAYKGVGNFDSKMIMGSKSIFSVISPAVNTLLMIVACLLLSFPIAIFSAMFLWFYEHHFPRTVHLVQALIDSLGAIPSIVYALFGLIFLVDFLGLGFSFVAGVLTLAMIVLPVLIRSAEQALSAIPKEVYLSGVSLGASKIRVMLFVMLPQATGGILSGVLLAAGRIVGESAALIFSFGTADGIVRSLFSSGKTLAVQVYSLSVEGMYLPYAYATATVLLIFAAILHLCSGFFVKRGSKYGQT